MNIPQIAVTFADRNSRHPGDINITHPYRRRWWLPVIGPTATVLLDHLSDHDPGHWQIYNTAELATTLGLSAATGLNSPLLRTFHRLVRFGFATFDIEPGQTSSGACLTAWNTTRLVPEYHTRKWAPTIQDAHLQDLAAIHRATL